MNKVKKIFTLVTYAFLIIASSNTFSSTPTKILKVPIFISVNNIYNINPGKSTFSTNLWIGTLNKKPDQLKILDTEFIGAIQKQKLDSIVKKLPNGSFITLTKYRLTILHDFNLSKYPFDQQKFAITLEANETSNIFQYIIPERFSKDTSPSSNLSDIILPPRSVPNGWKKIKSTMNIRNHEYPPVFLTKKNNVASYSRANINITLQRNNLRQFFSLFSTLYLAYFLILYALFIPLRKAFITVKHGFISASIFSLVGNYIITGAILQHSIQFSLIDKLQILTIVLVIINLLITTYTLNLATKTTCQEKQHKLFSISRLMGVASLIIYIIGNILIL